MLNLKKKSSTKMSQPTEKQTKILSKICQYFFSLKSSQLTSKTTSMQLDSFHSHVFQRDLTSKTTAMQLDEFWGVSPSELMQGIYKLFCENGQKLGLKTDLPFWEFVETLHHDNIIFAEPTDGAIVESKTPQLKGIIGKIGHGKSTVSTFLVQQKGFEEFAFANPLKYGCAAAFCLSHEQCFGSLKEVIDNRLGVTPRFLFQTIGTDLFRNMFQQYFPNVKCSNSIWIANFLKWYSSRRFCNVVVSDIRFEDELNAVKSLGGEIWKIVRPSLLQSSASSTKHVSEDVDKLKFDKLINNFSTKDDLYVIINSMV